MPGILRLAGIVLLAMAGIVLVWLALTPDGVYGEMMGHGDARRSLASLLIIPLIQGAIVVALLVTIPLGRIAVAACWIAVAWALLGACIWIPLFISAVVTWLASGGAAGLLNVSAVLSLAYLFGVLTLVAAARELGTDAPPPWLA